MTTQALTNFNFEDCSIRVFGDFIKPLFVAADVCKALSIQNVTQALQALAPFEKTTVEITRKNPRSDSPMLNIGQLKETVNAVTESGLYTLILRCRDAVKEGTFAYRFRVWVTNEMLPSIRKTGGYQCPAIDQLTTLTPQQAREIQIAVAEKATIHPANYRAIYSALKKRFQVARYDQIPSSCFREALDFIERVELNTPQHYPVQNYLPPVPAIPDAHLRITEDELSAIKSAVYYFDELFKPQIQWAASEARRQNRPDSSRFYDVWHEPAWLIFRLKQIIERNS